MEKHRLSGILRVVQVVMVFVIGASFGVIFTMRFFRQEINLAKPQLDVKNTGTAPMLVRLGDFESARDPTGHRGDKGGVVVQPGGGVGYRVSLGQVLTVFSGQDESAKSKAFQFGAGASPIRISAEINADNPEKIEARYIFASDWTK